MHLKTISGLTVGMSTELVRWNWYDKYVLFDISCFHTCNSRDHNDMTTCMILKILGIKMCYASENVCHDIIEVLYASSYFEPLFLCGNSCMLCVHRAWITSPRMFVRTHTYKNDSFGSYFSRGSVVRKIFI